MEIAFLEIQPAEINNLQPGHAKLIERKKLAFHPTLSITGNQKDIKSLAVKININGDSSNIKCRFSYPSTTWTPSISLSDQPPTGWIKISYLRTLFS